MGSGGYNYDSTLAYALLDTADQWWARHSASTASLSDPNGAFADPPSILSPTWAPCRREARGQLRGCRVLPSGVAVLLEELMDPTTGRLHDYSYFCDADSTRGRTTIGGNDRNDLDSSIKPGASRSGTTVSTRTATTEATTTPTRRLRVDSRHRLQRPDASINPGATELVRDGVDQDYKATTTTTPTKTAIAPSSTGAPTATILMTTSIRVRPTSGTTVLTTTVPGMTTTTRIAMASATRPSAARTATTPIAPSISAHLTSGTTASTLTVATTATMTPIWMAMTATPSVARTVTIPTLP